MSDRSVSAARIEDAVRATREQRVVIKKPASFGKSECLARRLLIVPLPYAHWPMQHQAGWRPPIIRR